MLLQGVQILLSISSSPCSKQLGKDAHNDFHLQTLQQACTLQKAQSSALYRVAAALTALHNRRCCAAAACPAMGVDTDNCRADVLHLFYLTLNFGCIFKALYRVFGSRRNTKTQPLIPNNQQAARSCSPVSKSKRAETRLPPRLRSARSAEPKNQPGRMYSFQIIRSVPNNLLFR